MATISLKCKECGGVLEVDADREVLSCPYCGSKELFLESDEVKIERIRSKAYTDVELKKLENEEKKDARAPLKWLYYILIGIGVCIAYVLLMKLALN